MLPLSLKLNDADTSMPILVEGKYPLVIDKAEVVQSKSGKGSFLAVTYKTLEDAQGSKGQNISAGFPIIQRYMLPIPGTEFGDGEQAGNYRLTSAASCSRWQLKDTPENKASLPEFNMDYIASLQGVNVTGTIKTAKPKDDSDEYGERSEVKSVNPIG
jgi:hypothetical protein